MNVNLKGYTCDYMWPRPDPLPKHPHPRPRPSDLGMTPMRMEKAKSGRIQGGHETDIYSKYTETLYK